MNQDLKKRLLLIGAILGGIIVVITIIALIVHLFIGGRMSYDKVLATMKEAAVKYYDVHSQLLPKEGEDSVDASTLAETEFMKPLAKIVPKGNSCTGKVVVRLIDDHKYSYTPYLDCGKDYQTIELYKKITDNKNIVTSSNGLYQIGDEYVYRGENINNYVQLQDSIWRITKVTSNHDIQLILAQKTSSDTWDDRFNTTKNYNAGINDYSVSRVRDYLKNLYESNTLFDDSIKDKLTPFNACVGHRGSDEAVNDGSIECSTTMAGEKYSLLPLNEYIMASLDSTCSKPTDAQCQNYNYLAFTRKWWTITGDKNSTHQVYGIDSDGQIKLSSAMSMFDIRPIVRLANNVMYQSGDGTLENPYLIK